LALGGNLSRTLESAPAVTLLVLASSYNLVKGGGAAAFGGLKRRSGGHVIHFVVGIGRWRGQVLLVDLVEWIQRWWWRMLVVDVIPVVVFLVVTLAIALGRERVVEKGPQIKILRL
jgi:hypothetical protein